MADPRFFRVSGPFTIAEIAAKTGAAIGRDGVADRLLVDVAPLETAGPDRLSFLSNRRYAAQFAASSAGAIFVAPEVAGRAPAATVPLITKEPYAAYARAAALFYPEQAVDDGIAPTAAIDPSAILGARVVVGHHAVIEAGAEIGPGTRIGANAVVGPGVVIGRDSRIGPNVTLAFCLVGDRVILHPGVRVGQDGFGFALRPDGHVKVPQLGRVVIEDDVEIGANCTIDRGAGPDTVIGAGTKIDNLVQIGHNVVIGKGCILVAQAGIAGSTRLGDLVSVGGQAAIIGHLTIGSGARISGQAGVIRDVGPGETVGGSPAVPHLQWLREAAVLTQLAKRRKG